MNLQRILCGGTILVGAIFFDGVALAQVQTLDIIEHSSSLLTAKFNGTDIPAADIVENSSDNWTITLPGITEAVVGFAAWLEGFEPPPLFVPIDNFVAGNANSIGTVSVQSDQDDGQGLGNGDTSTQFKIGTAELDVTFTDNGDPVPDAAATLSLLTLSLAGLGFAKRMFLRTV